MANNAYPDELAHDTPTHLDLPRLQKYPVWSAGLRGLNMPILLYFAFFGV